MGFKAIYTGDWHLSNRLPHAVVVGNGETDRLRQQIALIDKIYASATKHKAKAIIVVGDIFDRSLVDAVTLTAATGALSRAPVPVYILPGNHDASSVKGGRFTVEAFGEMNNPNLHVIRGQFELANIDFYAFPFQPVKETQIDMALIQEKLVDDGRPKVMLFHNSVLGCDHLDWTCDDGLDPDEICDGYDLVVGGHFHQYQEFGSCGMYVGAPMAHNFGDKGKDSGYWLIDINRKSKKYTKKFIPGGAPDFHVIESPGAEGNPADMGKVWNKGDYVRMETTCTNAEWVQIEPNAMKIRDHHIKNGVNVTLKHKPVYKHEKRLVKASAGAKLSLTTAIGEYVKDTSTEGLDAKKLKSIGKEILATVRSEIGAV